MSKILILYGTTEGHTRNVANFISDILTKAGYETDIVDSATNPPLLEKGVYDGIIIGSSVHQDKHHKAVEYFVKNNRDVLNDTSSAFFSVCLSAAINDAEHLMEAQGYIDDFLELTRWAPSITASFGGALLYTKYDYFKRLVMKMISAREKRDTDTSKDYVYTNWDDVSRFANDFIVLLKTKSTQVKENI